jgi:hypothetical protein
MGKVLAYAGLSIACAFAWLFVNRYVPETKGLTTEQCLERVNEARYTPVADLDKV